MLSFMVELSKIEELAIDINNSLKYSKESGVLGKDFFNIVSYMFTRMFVPLLDTCHALMDIQSVIDIPEWTLKDYISNYKSSNYVIHLSYAVGMEDNIDNNHGATFRSNPALLDLIIKELYELDVEVSLVLEIIEDGGYDSPPESLGMMIEELKESEKRTEIDLNW